MPSLVPAVALKPSAAVEQPLRRLGRLRVRIPRMRHGRQRMQQPEQRAQRDVLGIHEFLDPELLARLGHARYHAAVVDSGPVGHGGVEQLDALGRELQHRALVPLDLAKVLPHGVATIEPDLAQHALGNAIQCAFIAPQAVVEPRDHCNCLRRGQDRAPSLSGRRQCAQHEQQRLALHRDEVIGERRAVVRRAHGNRRPRQPGDALFRVAARRSSLPASTACARRGRRSSGRRSAVRWRAGRRWQSPAGAARRRAAGSRPSAAFRTARHGPRPAPAERRRECLFHVLEVAQGADRREAEKARYQEHESLAHGQIMRSGARCGTAPTCCRRTPTVQAWTFTGDET